MSSQIRVRHCHLEKKSTHCDQEHPELQHLSVIIVSFGGSTSLRDMAMCPHQGLEVPEGTDLSPGWPSPLFVNLVNLQPFQNLL